MSQVATKKFTIVAAGTPQPLIGTYLAASVVAGNMVVCTVGDSSMFAVGNRVRLIAADGTNGELNYVAAVGDATHITVRVLSKNHTGGVFGTGEWVCLAEPVNSVYVQLVAGNAGLFYIGERPTMVKATYVGVIATLLNTAAGIQPVEFSTTRSGLTNVDDVGQLFVDGTTGDAYVPSFGQV